MIKEEEEEPITMTNNLSSFLKTISSYNSNVLLAALVFLLLVVLFVLLLHFYARFFLSHSDQETFSAARFHRRRRRRRINHRRRTVTTTRIIPSLPLRGFNNEAISPTADDKGLDPSVISSIPLFLYEEEDQEEEECAICLGMWEVGDLGRKLRNCEHGFHVECIDMWLSSHSTCPLCRNHVLLSVSDQTLLKPDINGVQEQEISPSEEEEEDNVGDGRRFSVSEDNRKTGVYDRDGDGEVRIEMF
ncbi:unnamed protein product [Cochlearia groenlandica]